MRPSIPPLPADTSRSLWTSLVGRLAAVIAAVMILVTVGAYLGITRHERALLVGSKVQTVERLLDLFVYSAGPAVAFGDAETLSQDIRDLSRNPDVLELSVWAVEPAAPGAGPLASFQRGPQAPPGRPAVGESLTVLEQTVDVRRLVRDPEGKSIGLVAAVFSLERENAAIRQTTQRILGIASLAALGTILVLVLAVGRSLLQPMRELRMRRELEIANRIQQALLPNKPQHPDFDIAGKMVAADEVGGDFFDVLSRDERLWITMGDVSGHGLSAGLIMLMTQSAFGTEFRSRSHDDVNEIMDTVNGLLCENIARRLEQSKYVTCQLMVHRGDGVFDAVGGHVWPLIYRASTKTIERVTMPGPWLGIEDPWVVMPPTRITLEPGDVLCLYSDGATEARNAAGELYDEDRFVAALERALAPAPRLEVALDEVFAEIKAFSADQEDDISMLLVRRRLPGRLGQAVV